MTIGELMAVLGIDTTQLDGAEEKLKEFAKKAKEEFEKTDKSAEDAEEGIEGLGGSIKGLTPIFIAATAAAGLMVDWFMKTEAGADAAALSTSILTEAMDGFMQQRGWNMKEAVSIAEEENRLRQQGRVDMVEIAYLSAQLRKDRMAVYDIEATIDDKIESQRSALEKQKAIEDKLTAGLYEQLAVVERRLALNPTKTKWLDKEAALQTEILNVQNSGSLLMQRTLNTLEKQKRTMEAIKRLNLSEAYDIDIKDKIDAGTTAIENINTWSKLFGNTIETTESRLESYKSTLNDLIEFGLSPASEEVQTLTKKIKTLEEQLKSLETKSNVLKGLEHAFYPQAGSYSFAKYKPPTKVIGGGMARGGLDLARGPYPITDEEMQKVNASMETTMNIVNQLDQTFQAMFTNIGGGFKGMINSMVDSLRLLAAELIAKAAVFAILKLISTGGSSAAIDVGRIVGKGFWKFAGFADGTNNAPGGLALVGERGPELVNLPRGSQVIPSHLAGAAFGGGQVVFEIEGTKLVGVLQNQSRKNNSFR